MEVASSWILLMAICVFVVYVHVCFQRYSDWCTCTHEHDRYGGGLVMIWGKIWSSERTRTVIVNGTLTPERYKSEYSSRINAKPYFSRLVTASLDQSNTETSLAFQSRWYVLHGTILWNVIGHNVYQDENDLQRLQGAYKPRHPRNGSFSVNNNRNPYLQCSLPAEAVCHNRGGHTACRCWLTFFLS